MVSKPLPIPLLLVCNLLIIRHTLVSATNVKQEIQLNEETVSAGSPYKNYNPEAKGALATIRQLIFAGRYPEAQALAGEKILSKNGFGMPYQTVGSLRLDFPSHENYTNFRRELDLEKAVATTAYTVNGIDYKREVFTSLSTSWSLSALLLLNRENLLFPLP